MLNRGERFGKGLELEEDAEIAREMMKAGVGLISGGA